MMKRICQKRYISHLEKEFKIKEMFFNKLKKKKKIIYSIPKE